MRGLVTGAHRLPAPLRRGLRRLPGAYVVRDRLRGSPQLTPPTSRWRPVVYLPTWARWDVMRQRPQFMLEAFAHHGHPVYFVDSHVRRVRRVDGVHVVPSLKDVPGIRPILYVHFPPLRTLFDAFTEPTVVYDIVDDLSIYDADEVAMPEHRRVRAHHPVLMREADVVIVSNPVLAERHRSERSDLLLVENGVSYQRFAAPTVRPDDLPPHDQDRPVVGYHGAVAPWFDFELLAGVAHALPRWWFVLVGPIDPRCAGQARAVGRLSNVMVLGERPSDAMPRYAQGFDVGVVPFRMTTMTEAVTPLKMFEYLAGATPVVAAPLPACVATPGVRIARDVSGFVRELQEARHEAGTTGFADLARRTAVEADWSRRIGPVLDAIARCDGRGMAREDLS